jgi:hypothetical protein
MPENENKKTQDADEQGPRQPWERRRTESVRAFAAFSLWLHAEKRQLIDVAAKLNPPCSVQNVSRWSHRHDWASRAWQFDLMREQEEREQQARDRMAMRKRHLQVSMLMQSIAVRGLEELRAKVACGTPLGLSPDECKNMMAEGTKLERLTLGTDRERTHTKIIVNLGDLDDSNFEETVRGGHNDGAALELDGEVDAKKRPN